MEESSKYYNLRESVIKYKKFTELIKFSRCIKFTTILYLILHVSIIVIFEILFYFLYIIKKEYEVFDYLIYDITHKKYYYLNESTKELINNLLMNMTNINYIKSQAEIDRKNRLYTKNQLYNTSQNIIVSVVLLSSFIIIYGFLKKKIILKYLLLDLIILLSLIGLFEYMFFKNIISHIRPISPYELLNKIITNFEDIYIDN
jgi:hypothetical protein